MYMKELTERNTKSRVTARKPQPKLGPRNLHYLYADGEVIANRIAIN